MNAVESECFPLSRLKNGSKDSLTWRIIIFKSLITREICTLNTSNVWPTFRGWYWGVGYILHLQKVHTFRTIDDLNVQYFISPVSTFLKPPRNRFIERAKWVLLNSKVLKAVKFFNSLVSKLFTLSRDPIVRLSNSNLLKLNIFSFSTLNSLSSGKVIHLVLNEAQWRELEIYGLPSFFNFFISIWIWFFCAKPTQKNYNSKQGNKNVILFNFRSQFPVCEWFFITSSPVETLIESIILIWSIEEQKLRDICSSRKNVWETALNITLLRFTVP